MGRNLHLVKVSSPIQPNQTLIVGNIHLESVFQPINHQIQSQQLQESLVYLDRSYPNQLVILTGDTNLTCQDKVSIPTHWQDIWEITGCTKSNQYTYDGYLNRNIHRKIQKRFDRIYLRTSLPHTVTNFNLIGQETIPEWNIQPSDHFGIYWRLNINI